MTIESCISIISDPRNDKNKYYALESLVLIIFSSVISGYDTIDGMVEYARLKIDWLKKFVPLDRAPSAETLRYLLNEAALRQNPKA